MRTFTLIAALALGGAVLSQPAMAQDSAPKTYPPCSKSVQDECVNPSQMPHRMVGHGAMIHKTAAHKKAQRISARPRKS